MKKITAIIASVLAVTLLTAFADVPKDYWGCEGISQAQSFGFINGVTADTFEPSSTINKQEVAILSYRMYDLITSSEMGDLEKVEPDETKIKAAGVADWAAQEISYGFENSFWSVEDFGGTDGGWADAERQLIAKWLVQISGFRTFGLQVIPYTDSADIDPEYYSSIDTMYKYGIMKGSDNGMFYPKEGIQRAEAAVAAVREYTEKLSKTSKIDQDPILFKSGTAQSFSTANRSFELNGELLCIDKDAVILLNGQTASFDEIAALSGKKISVSSVICGDNYKEVIVQTGPASISGNLQEIKACGTLDNTSVAVIEINGSTFDFVMDENTEKITSDPSGEVQFISDGVYILEIK